ncbi:4-galactosyl-N-acetylglucosaminide 3-alpha-L-fucosyltransferase 9-like [Chelmon rostratus]|uniref:4-galactosyl-N-acetylglucosaminide 3-alpha-L-fucosyltransferase 9-like n=1 Tax=Chelmon rostratus TaxID=109905 RepID=UPI001BEBA554|nr:4-galactosyl-N-acetylglucosaminide 3-alpha-L-fucosyltransferase 9-like [Chelmon rostratus]XP_041819577.1 4-galactosyl-N-acetylglucosaminide 3-alpha-L-fucosyltransferase 9-like [Chelmon rostratus]XP_041819578.1 4-galactosyl-N-acetylglucosaminide 3-alpha-L-fucosyltransferase 9-like [Chelmon rostratus]XP_041819579.1 4-galactosyl-N-acetylglucosaminide 3-alpha-L-fucosyltransferase 9-like [Chelmon rostratus]XP_041819580.1 4-galactosyl-N-acetylglucosaminide 3-alpha-L-fucosyltransferase 9-like [Chel
MSSSACQWTFLRPFVISSLLVMSFVVLFCTYYKPDIKFPTFDIYMERGNHSCPTVVCAEGPQIQNSNCSTELHINPDHNDNQKVQTAAVDTEPDTILLIWMWPFGRTFDVNCGIYNIERCLLTDDKSLYHKAHGVIFHHRDIHGNLASLPKEPRPWFQKWVWSNMESPANSAPIPEVNHLFNLTCNYRLDSNIPVPYGYLLPVTPEDESFKLPAKDKLVCWVVSNWNAQFKRVQFYNEMKDHIKIHTYGKAFGQDLSEQDYSKIVSSCKFYLSFENSVYKDYITEKLYRPMSLGTVPIVLGTQRQQYEDHIPGDSFIHVNDFSTPKELAERLIYLDQNNSEYMRYFNWTSRFKVKTSWFGKEQACKTCGYLQNHKGYQAFHDLNKWYWG